MINVDGVYGFRVDRGRLETVALEIYKAAREKTGIFRSGFERFLPEYNLPLELEYSPRKVETKNPLEAARYLWTSVFFERLSQSRVIMRNSLRVWRDEQRRWIFYPEMATERKSDEIKEVLLEGFQFGLQGRNEESPADRFLYNAQKLVAEYDGDPRNLINYNTVSQARANLMDFKGIGSGIANLFIIYLLNRQIAMPRDPENILFKVDIHKGRIPLNTDSVVTKNGEVHRHQLTEVLEGEYLDLVKRLGLDASFLDSAFWIIGSEVCARQDYSFCCSNCPLVDRLCISNVQENEQSGRFMVYDEKGKRIETRKNMGQEMLNF